MELNRFNQLLESTMGNVKPLIMEQPTGTTQTSTGGTQTSGYSMPIKDVRDQQAFDKIGYNGNFNIDKIQNLIYIYNSKTKAGVPTNASFPLLKPKDFKLSQGTWTYDPNTKSVSFL